MTAGKDQYTTGESIAPDMLPTPKLLQYR